MTLTTRTRTRAGRAAALVATASAAFALTACSGEELTERIVEESLGDGSSVEVDEDGEQVSIEGADGSSFDVGSGELPDDFPSDDVPVLDLDVVSSLSSDDGYGGQIWSVSLLEENGDLDELFDEAVDLLEDAGYEQTATADYGELLSWIGADETWQVTVAGTADGDAVTLQYSVADAPE